MKPSLELALRRTAILRAYTLHKTERVFRERKGLPHLHHSRIVPLFSVDNDLLLML